MKILSDQGVRVGGGRGRAPDASEFLWIFPKFFSCKFTFFLKFAGRSRRQKIISQYFQYKWVRGRSPQSARGNLKFLQKNRMISMRFKKNLMGNDNLTSLENVHDFFAEFVGFDNIFDVSLTSRYSPARPCVSHVRYIIFSSHLHLSFGI